MRKEKTIDTKTFMEMFLSISYLQEQCLFNYSRIADYIMDNYCMDDTADFTMMDLTTNFIEVFNEMFDEGLFTQVAKGADLYRISDKINYKEILLKNQELLKDMIEVFYNICGGNHKYIYVVPSKSKNKGSNSTGKIDVNTFVAMFIAINYLQGNQPFNLGELGDYVSFAAEKDAEYQIENGYPDQKKSLDLYNAIIDCFDQYAIDELLSGSMGCAKISDTIKADYIIKENMEYLEVMKEFCDRFRNKKPCNIIVSMEQIKKRNR